MQVVVVSTGSNRDAVKLAMNRWSIEPLFCSGIKEVGGLLPRAGRTLIFCEEQLSDGDYRDLLRDLGRTRRALLVVISATGDLDQVYREAAALGAFEAIASPCTPADVQWIAIRALQDARRRPGYRTHAASDPTHALVPGPNAAETPGAEGDLSHEPR
jgi:DNA-binding NtrC family response regulator